MKVFISHVFGGDDEAFATALKGDLGAAGMDGYMAEKAQRYDLVIHDKIRQEIEESEWLVAVITERSQASPSVHEEIGYALGKGVRVALMVERGVKEGGVLIYGREPAVFDPHEFGAHSKKVAEAIKAAPRGTPKRHATSDETEWLLERRRLVYINSEDFAKNEHFDSMYSGLPDAEKPAALFTACPLSLDGRYDVTDTKFVEWMKSIDRIAIGGRQLRMPGHDWAVDIGALHALAKLRSEPRDRDVLAYMEFQSTGFAEWGTSHLFFDRNGRGKMELVMCHMVGRFCAFLAYVRLFYRKIGMDAPFAALLSVKNTGALDLGNYGGEVVPCPWDVRHHFSSVRRDPATRHTNIRVSHTFNSVGEMNDDGIASAARKVAKYICNAYGETAPRCYGSDGSFLWDLYEHASGEQTRSGCR